MKELSIEEKAKRYDEAIKFAYNKHRFSSNLSEIKLIEELFPELQESEDDRIINNIKKAVEYYWSDEPLYEILDWLEKRGKKPNNVYDKESSEILGCVIRRYINDPNIPYTEREKVSMETIPYVERLEKQGGKGTNGNEREIPISEQKPAIKLERDDNGEAVLTPFEAELFSMMSEAWQGYSFGEEVNIAKIVKEYSKELLERANEQKPAWSEEDEYYLAGVIETELYMLDVVNGVKKFDVGNESIKEECTKELAWLKSLKERIQPQNTWKPSNEQMLAINTAINVLGKGTINGKYLIELQEQLKKLMEE